MIVKFAAVAALTTLVAARRHFTADDVRRTFRAGYGYGSTDRRPPTTPVDTNRGRAPQLRVVVDPDSGACYPLRGVV